MSSFLDQIEPLKQAALEDLRSAKNLAALRQLLSETPGRMVVAIAAAWLTAGMCAALATAAATGGREIRRVLLAEAAITCLVVIDALFALFVALQVAYLFGGRDTVDAAGVTYSTYGRTGFFELVAVASVVTVLLFALDHIVLGRPRAYAAAALVLLMFTAVVLASATLRMWLYQQAYGWSELRFYAFVGIAYLATHKYHEALEAFHAALTLDPSSLAAAQRARQARASALAEDEERDRERHLL